MFESLQISGYKSLNDVALEFSNVTLIAGGNGSGKSGIFEAVHGLRRCLYLGDRYQDAFPARRAFRWTTTVGQGFKLCLRSRDQQFDVQLALRINHERNESTLVLESASRNGELFFQQIHRHLAYRNYKAEKIEFERNQERSFLPEIIQSTRDPGDEDYPSQFMIAVSRIGVFKLNPWAIANAEQSIHDNVTELQVDGGNFVDWYRSWIATTPEQASLIINSLTPLIPGIRALRLLQVGNARQLKIEIQHGSESKQFGLSELSDGQRVLLALACIVHSKQFDTLLLDEPDTHVASSELQPLLREISDHLQLIFSSHRAEGIDFGASRSAILLRLDNGATIATPLTEIDLEGEKLSTALRLGLVG
jgi:predicted ATPase